MLKIVWPLLASVALSGCSHSTPSQSELKQTLQDAALDHIAINGMNLPRDAFSLNDINVLAVDKRMVGDTPHFHVTANTSITLEKSGSEIIREVGRSGSNRDMGSILALRQFVSGMGVTIQQGIKFNYAIDADVISSDGKYVVDEGSITQQ